MSWAKSQKSGKSMLWILQMVLDSLLCIYHFPCRENSCCQLHMAHEPYISWWFQTIEDDFQDQAIMPKCKSQLLGLCWVCIVPSRLWECAYVEVFAFEMQWCIHKQQHSQRCHVCRWSQWWLSFSFGRLMKPIQVWLPRKKLMCDFWPQWIGSHCHKYVYLSKIACNCHWILKVWCMWHGPPM